MNLAGKPDFGGLSKNLAFDKTKLDDAEGYTYTLTNEVPAQLFFFGNPTMGLIDMYKFCSDNAGVLHGETNFILYELAQDGASYITHDIRKASDFFLEPMHAVGLMALSAGTSLSLVLKPSAIAGSAGDLMAGAPGQHHERRKAANEEQNEATLYIAAANTTAYGETFRAYMVLGESDNASDAFVSGEDALSLVSDTYNETNLHTPMSLYSVCDNYPLLYDRRTELQRVPLALALMSDYYDFGARTLLSFAYEGTFAEPLYLHDALSGDSILIINGMTISVSTPASDQIRYFINGTKRMADDSRQQGTTTDIESVKDESPMTDALSGTVIYDMLGRKVMTLQEHELISNITLPTGVYIIRRGNSTERRVIR